MRTLDFVETSGEKDIREAVREHYGAIARTLAETPAAGTREGTTTGSCCGPSRSACGCAADKPATPQGFSGIYAPEEIAGLPGTVTDAPVQALVFRGPPPQTRPARAGIKLWMWFGLGLGLVAVAVLARLYLTGRAKPAEPAEPGKDDLRAAPGLLMKEPLDLPQEAVLAEGL